MGRIIGYQYDNDIKDDDAWIGTEATSRRTKQYTAQAVADYLNINGSISIVGQMSYKYSTTPLNGIGTFAVFGGGPNIVAFSAITKLTLSNQDISEQRVVEYLNLLVGSDMLISESEQISTFGYYSIDSYAVNATNSDYYDLSVTFKSGNGSMEADKIYETQNFTLAAEENISTLQTTIDAGNTYQETASSPLWTWGSVALQMDGSSAINGYEGIFSGKYVRLKSNDFPNYTTLANGSLVIPLPGAVDTRFRLTANPLIEEGEEVGILSPATSGTLALTTDIIDSPWDTVLGGINYAGGNVGIGTTGPLAKLHVFGGSAIIGDDDFNAVKISSGTSGTTYNTIGNGFIAPNVNFNINNQTRLAINGNTGNVGIGTTSPSKKLEVRNGDVLFENTSSSNTFFDVKGSSANGYIRAYSDSNSVWLYQGGNNSYLQAQSGSTLRLGSGTANIVVTDSSGEVMRISAGNVGIGTTSPSTPLDVRGDITIRNANGGNPVDAGSLYFTEAGNTWGTDIYGFRINQEGSASYLQFQSSVAATVIDILTLARNTGNVGIGTTSPSEKLDVVGNIKVRGTNNLTISSTSSGGDFNLSSGIRGYKFSNNNGDLVSITSNGNVGIGTTSPSVTLDVASDNPKIRLTDIDGGIAALEGNLGNLILIADNGNTEADSRVAFKVDGSEKMRIDSSGNVGIGTTSPSQKLEVEGNIYTGGSIRIKDAGDQLEFGNANVALQRTSNLLELGGYDGIVFKSSNTVLDGQSERMRITTAGNVGIGTTSPARTLHLVSSTTGDGLIIENDAAEAAFYIKGVGDTQNTYSFVKNQGIDGLLLRHNSDTFGFGGNIASFLRNGNVGIGTTSPSYKLEVDGTFLASGNSTIQGRTSLQKDLTIRGNDALANQGVARFYVDSSNNLYIDTANDGANLFTIKGTNGNVGIGTTSPSTLLDLDTSIDTAGGINLGYVNSVDRSLRLFFTNNTGGNAIYKDGASLKFTTEAAVGSSSGVTKMTLLDSGNVGIGTTSPQEKLDISAGNIRLDNNRELTWATTDANVGRVRITGNESTDSISFATDNSVRMALTNTGLGIGTTSPVSKLEVDGGDIEVDDSASGLILRSPDGTRYRITVANGGTLTVTAV